MTTVPNPVAISGIRVILSSKSPAANLHCQEGTSKAPVNCSGSRDYCTATHAPPVLPVRQYWKTGIDSVPINSVNLSVSGRSGETEEVNATADLTCALWCTLGEERAAEGPGSCELEMMLLLQWA